MFIQCQRITCIKCCSASTYLGHQYNQSGTFVYNMYTRLKHIKKVTRYRVSDQHKAGKQGRDDSIKHFRTQLHLIHIYSLLKICRVGVYTELFYAIIPTLFPCFLLICYPYISYMFMFLSLVLNLIRPYQ